MECIPNGKLVLHMNLRAQIPSKKWEIAIKIHVKKTRYVLKYTYILIYSCAQRPSESLGLHNYGRLFFPIDCLLSPPANLHLIELSIYLPAISSGFAFLLLPFGLLSNILTVLPKSILTTCPIHSSLFLFNISYCI